MNSIGDEDYQKHMASVVGDGFTLDPPGYERLSQWTHVLMHIVNARTNFQWVLDHPVDLGDLDNSLQQQAFFVAGIMAYGRCYASSGPMIPMLDATKVYQGSNDGMEVHTRLNELRNTIAAHTDKSDLVRLTLAVKDEPTRVVVRHLSTARFGRVLLFDPTNAKSDAYNPLLEVRRGEWEVRDVQNIADVLVDPEGALEKRNHWEKTSHSLLVGTILHVLYAEKDKTLAGVANFLSDPKRPIETTLRAMMATPHLGKTGVHPVVASAARELLNKSENERSGVLSTAMSFLGLYRDPVVAAVTARCDWRIRDLVEAEHPVTLYLVVPPSDISRTKPLIRLILNQIGRRLTEELESKRRRHRLLLMLDEFPALGRLDFFESALAFMAGYGLKSFLIAQSLNQIEKAYGQNNSILDNCHVRVSFATNDERTAKRVSDALGTATEMRAMKNYAGSRLSPWLGHLMVSRQETARPLLTPGEVMQLPPDDELVLMSGCAPIRAKKARYFEDPEMAARILSPPARTDPRPRPTAGPPVPSDGDWADAVVAPAASDTEDPANAGIRREPELPEHEEIVPEPLKPMHEFDPMDEEPDDEVQRQRIMQRTFGIIARQVSLDPDDDMQM